ncbi:unnamed protein product [Pseudo-nitzschia multistriata]|uniref:Uncharacterized protein n=1 Tax=Pseudo-nitzschia multistriata TaxID=183589 RepID=A0A448Z9S9_9STRA|nr:unnamed protein product [Pseudo-nitzschia multistriata]
MNHQSKTSNFHREDEQPATEELGSLFSRLKCKNTGEEIISSRKSLKSKTSSKKVHKILTPWLVNDRAAKISGESISKGIQVDDRDINLPMRTEHVIYPSVEGNSVEIQSTLAPASNSKTQVQNKNSIGSVLFGRRRRSSSKSNAIKSSEYNESKSYPQFGSFPENESDEDKTRNNKLRGSEEKIVSTNPVNGSDNLSTSVAEKAGIKPTRTNSYDQRFSYSNGTNSILDNDDDCGLPSMMTSSTISTKYDVGDTSENKTGVRCSQRDIVTPRRRNSRSPSPSRMRREPNPMNPSDSPKNGKVQHHQKVKFKNDWNHEMLMAHEMNKQLSQLSSSFDCGTMNSNSHEAGKAHSKKKATIQNDWDHEMLMAVEMKKQLSQMSSSFDCGTMNGKNRETSFSGSTRESLRQENEKISVLSSSAMSCLNPTSQLSSLGKPNSTMHGTDSGNENNQNLINISGTRQMSTKPATNTLCGAVSSALLLDVKDDDALWKYYERNKMPQLPLYQDQISKYREHITKQDPPPGSTAKAPVSNGEGRIIQDAPRFAGISNSNRIRPDKVDLQETSTRHAVINYSQNPPRHAPLTKADGYDHRRPYDNETTGFQINQGTNNNVSDRELQLRLQYESLMGYQNQASYSHEPVKPSKEQLLDQLRLAVRKASAELDSLYLQKGIRSDFRERYNMRTMETEDCSEESSFMPEYYGRNTQQRHLDHEEEALDYIISTGSIHSPTNRKDKYDFSY